MMSSSSRSSTILSVPAFALVVIVVMTIDPRLASAQLTGSGDLFLRQGVDGVPGTRTNDDRFGQVLAAGDFNADGFADLAIGAPSDDIAPTPNAGTVTVIPGSSSGLDIGAAEDFSLWGEGDFFGAALAVGDFDHDSFDDLAIGVPGYNVGAGAVVILYGFHGGVDAGGWQLWRQGSDGVVGVPEADDNFGSSLTVGDFNGDSFDDLAIGVRAEDVGAVADAGAVNVIFGSGAGLTTSGSAPTNRILTQEDLGLTSETGDRFGFSLSAADFSGDGMDDLVIGTPLEDLGAVADAGTVSVVLGASGGFSLVDPWTVSQNAAGIEGDAQALDRFGMTLAAGDFDGDGLADLAIASPGEAVAGAAGAGVIDVLRGTTGIGLTSAAMTRLDATDAGRIPEADDFFGLALAAFDVGSDYRDELAVGAPGIAVSGFAAAGGAFVIFGVDQPAPTSVQGFSQLGDVAGNPDPGDSFGASLAVGDFDGNGSHDLASGVPGEDIGEGVNVGAVSVLFSTHVFRDGFESGDTSRWAGGP